jgi:hypothetical protein
MPHSSDDPPGLPPAEDAATEPPSASRPSGPEGAGEVAEAPAGGQPDGGAPRPRRRRRRRRRPALTSAGAATREARPEEAASSPDSTIVESAENAVPDETRAFTPPRRRRRRRPIRDTGSQAPATSGDSLPQEAALSGDGAENPPGGKLSLPGGAQTSDAAAREQPRRRSRRRRPPRPDQTPASGGREGLAPDTGAEPRRGAALARRPRVGGLLNRRPNDAAPRQAGPRGDQRGRAAPTGSRSSEARDRGPRGRGARDQGSRDRRQGRGRDAPQKRIEQKLYALESVVDRGFEDVADQSDESATRRIHWAILKRTVADQKSGKPMSAVYVLQREGVESEFPNLGAARLAVNKTIVHPEKLTLSKAEHAAAKK